MNLSVILDLFYFYSDLNDLCQHVTISSLFFLFPSLYSYADASGAGKDVYEFVSSEDGYIHSISFVLRYQPLYIVSSVVTFPL